MICRQKKTHLNPEPAPAIHPATSPQTPPPPRRRRKPQNSWVMPWILQRQENGCYSNLLADLIQADIPGYQDFVRMPPAVFYLIHKHIHRYTTKEVISFRKPLEVGLKLAITLRHPQQEKCTHIYSITLWLSEPPYVNLQGHPCGIPGRVFFFQFFLSKF